MASSRRQFARSQARPVPSHPPVPSPVWAYDARIASGSARVRPNFNRGPASLPGSRHTWPSFPDAAALQPRPWPSARGWQSDCSPSPIACAPWTWPSTPGQVLQVSPASPRAHHVEPSGSPGRYLVQPRTGPHASACGRGRLCCARPDRGSALPWSRRMGCAPQKPKCQSQLPRRITDPARGGYTLVSAHTGATIAYLKPLPSSDRFEVR